MRSGPSATILRQIERLVGGEALAGLSEGQLLDRFLSRHDERAFEALIVRHGPMVLGVCRRTLRDLADVEDAFQATFLILMKKAGVIRDRDQLGPWLYGVAHRVAVRARARATRRHAKEQSGAVVEHTFMESFRAVDQREIRAVLDDELSRLPEKFRSPIVLCYLEGLTHDEAAARLHCRVGTIRSRMATARDRLRYQLARRGVATSVAFVATVLAREASATTLPRALIKSTVRNAVVFATADGAAAGLVSTSVGLLLRGVLRTMSLSHRTAAATALLSVLVLTGGAVVVARQDREPFEDPRSIPTLSQKDAIAKKSESPAESHAGRVNGPSQAKEQSARPIEVYSAVEGSPRIIRLVPNGSRVKKGDVICELDSAAILDELTTKKIATRKAEAELMQAKLTVEVLNIDLSESLRGFYQDVACPLQIDSGDRDVVKANAELKLAKERLELAKNDAPADLLAVEISFAQEGVLRAKIAVYDASKSVDPPPALNLDTTFPRPIAVVRREFAKAEVDLKVKDERFKADRNQEDKLKDQVRKCQITAPTAGVLTYAKRPPERLPAARSSWGLAYTSGSSSSRSIRTDLRPRSPSEHR
jgi:HlyD family secretion protein